MYQLGNMIKAVEANRGKESSRRCFDTGIPLRTVHFGASRCLALPLSLATHYWTMAEIKATSPSGVITSTCAPVHVEGAYG